MSIGYGVFVLIAIASFTASTTTYLISKATTSKHSDIEDVLAGHEFICYAGGMREILEMLHPKIKKYGVRFQNLEVETIIEVMRNGTCKYAVVGELWLQGAWQAGRHCDLKFVGSPIMTFPTGFWVNAELVPLMGWGIAQQRSEGQWAEAYSTFVGASKCQSNSRRLATKQQAHSDDGWWDSGDDMFSDNGDNRLGIENMIGVLLIIMAFFLLALLVRFVELTICPKPEDKEVEQILGKEVGQILGTEDKEVEQIYRDVSKSLETIKSLVEYHSARNFMEDTNAANEPADMVQRARASPQTKNMYHDSLCHLESKNDFDPVPEQGIVRRSPSEETRQCEGVTRL
jgi:hypothetical protein